MTGVQTCALPICGKSSQFIQPGGEIKGEDTTEIQDMLDQGKTTLSALQAILTRVENLVIEIEDGKGTIGKFLRDESLYNNLVGAADEMETPAIHLHPVHGDVPEQGSQWEGRRDPVGFQEGLGLVPGRGDTHARQANG